MDFLDPKKQRRHSFLLYSGYILIAVAILISTTVLVYQANGFGVNSKGEVTQSGLVFMSSQPPAAQIRVNGKLSEVQTNNRLSLPAGEYDIRLSRQNYRDWSHDVSVQGGDVQNFDYPFLVPKTLAPVKVDDYATGPGFASQSRDRRWLLVQQNPTAQTFTLYDLNKQVLQPTSLTLPTGIATAADGDQVWEPIQWANDNEHLLVKHTYGTGYEYVLIDRVTITDSVNLNTALKQSPQKLTLIDNKYDRYHVLADGVLSSAQLNNPEPKTLLKNVLEYKSYGDETLLYATDQGTNADKVNVVLSDGKRDYTLRQVAKGTNYVIDLANYRGDQYVVLGSSSEALAYVYKNPIEQLKNEKVTLPEAARALRVSGANYVSFSPNTQYIMAESGSAFGVYDIYNKRAYSYTMPMALDAPQSHAQWMDGSHLTYTAAGKQLIFDYDQRNQQTLMAALPAQDSQFSQDYRYVFSFTKPSDASDVTQLNRTPLRTAADL